MTHLTGSQELDVVRPDLTTILVLTHVIERELISLANDVSRGGIDIDPSDCRSSVVK